MVDCEGALLEGRSHDALWVGGLWLHAPNSEEGQHITTRHSSHGQEQQKRPQSSQASNSNWCNTKQDSMSSTSSAGKNTNIYLRMFRPDGMFVRYILFLYFFLQAPGFLASLM